MFWWGLAIGLFIGSSLSAIVYSALGLGGGMDAEWQAFRRGYDTGITEGRLRK